MTQTEWTEKKLREAVARELCKLDGISWDELDGKAEATIESEGIREDYYLKADGMLLLIKSATYLKGNEGLPQSDRHIFPMAVVNAYKVGQEDMERAGFKSTKEWDEDNR